MKIFPVDSFIDFVSKECQKFAWNMDENIQKYIALEKDKVILTGEYVGNILYI